MIHPGITQKQWTERYDLAKRFMESRKGIRKTLIEVASQHPLREGLYPAEEFEKRLSLGRELYLREIGEGKEVEIYVPGSRHVHNGVEDKRSLSDAGADFLISYDIPRAVVRGEDLNRRYKGADGVYCSADECFVASQYFKDGNFGRVLSVVSPVQQMRKALHYIWFGVIPLFYTAPVETPHHDYIREAYFWLPYVRDKDPDMQGTESLMTRKLREERKPK